MEKVWFFVEGSSEENFIINLMRKKYSQKFLAEKDLSAFVTKDLSASSHHLFYTENCHGVDKVPHSINERSHFVAKSGSTNIIIICDLERLACFSQRKTIIESIVREKINLDYLHCAFFKPTIEAGYWECEGIIESVISMGFREKFAKHSQQPFVLVKNIPPLDSLKKSFQKYKLKYRESKFSEEFFPRVDYEACQNLVLKRIISKLDSI